MKASCSFYGDRLGFTVAFVHGDPPYDGQGAPRRDAGLRWSASTYSRNIRTLVSKGSISRAVRASITPPSIVVSAKMASARQLSRE